MTRRLCLPFCILLCIVMAPIHASEWTNWRGPHANGGMNSGTTLVTQAKDVRLYWQSERHNPLHGRWKMKQPRPVISYGNGGYATPLVWNNRVYVIWYRPSGTVAGSHRRITPGQPRVATLIDGDSMVTCMDGRTGRTIWESAFVGEAINNHQYPHDGHMSGCIAEGKVVWLGNMGRMHCVDATTGKKLWSVSSGPASDNVATYKAWCIKHKLFPMDKIVPNNPDLIKKHAASAGMADPRDDHGSGGGGFNGASTYGDGVVIVNVLNELVAFKAEDGRILYRRPLISNPSSPITWKPKDRSYFISVRQGTIHCIEASTGTHIWSTPGSGIGHAYSGHTPSLAGNRLITGSPKNNGLRCWNISPSGIEEHWHIAGVFQCGYSSPTVIDGQVYAPIKNIKKNLKAILDNNRKLDVTEASQARRCVGRVDIESGRITGIVPVAGLSFTDAVAGDGLLAIINLRGIELFTTRPQLRAAGFLSVHRAGCISPVLVDGFLYARGAYGLLNCWDLRADQTTLPPAKTLTDQLMQLHLSASLPDGRDTRLLLGFRDGHCSQATITPGPRFVAPWLVEGTQLTKDKDSISGTLVTHADGEAQNLHLDVRLADGKISGRFQEIKVGKAIQGQITGQLAPSAMNVGTATLHLRREWNGGQNTHMATILTFDLKQGKAVNAHIGPPPGSDAWTATISHCDIQSDGRRLLGNLQCTIKSKGVVRSGTYTLHFNLPMNANRISGTFQVDKDGKDAQVPAQHRTLFGQIQVPDTETASVTDGVLTLDLQSALPGDKSLLIRLQTSNGKIIHQHANSPRFNTKDHQLDLSQLVLRENLLSGSIGVHIRSDGYVPAVDTPCIYTVNIPVTGTKLAGTFTGTYGNRAATAGAVTGIILNR